MNYSLTQFVKEAQPSSTVIDYIIRTNHHYILIVNQERNARILLNEENYAGITEDNGVYYIHSKKPILINGKSLISTFEVSLENGDDIIGFHSTDEAIQYCDKHSINTSKTLTSKLIFSPQLANYLLDKGFKIIHLKQHNKGRSTVFVFAVENGFYEAIGEYRNNKGETYDNKWFCNDDTNEVLR